MSGDILDLIDAAVLDWETGPDAARWNADGPTQQEQQDYWGAWFETYARLVGEQWAEQWRTLGTVLGGICERLIKDINSAALTMQQLGFRLRMLPGARYCPHQPLGEACDFCYPPPFPAARDYHRRTKHRNRRR
jgi:hypothetical protein